MNWIEILKRILHSTFLVRMISLPKVQFKWIQAFAVKSFKIRKSCMLVELSFLCLQAKLFQNLPGIKKPGNWQRLSNFSTWTFFLQRSWVTSQSFWSVISAQLNNQTIKTTINTIIMKTSTQAKRTQLYTTQLLVCIVLFSEPANQNIWKSVCCKIEMKGLSTGIYQAI